jgi:hypothetical protein
MPLSTTERIEECLRIIRETTPGALRAAVWVPSQNDEYYQVISINVEPTRSGGPELRPLPESICNADSMLISNGSIGDVDLRIFSAGVQPAHFLVSIDFSSTMSEKIAPNLDALAESIEVYFKDRATLVALSLASMDTSEDEFFHNLCSVTRSTILARSVYIWLVDKTTGDCHPKSWTPNNGPSTRESVRTSTLMSFPSGTVFDPREFAIPGTGNCKLATCVQLFGQRAGLITVQVDDRRLGQTRFELERIVSAIAKAIEGFKTRTMAEKLNVALSNLAKATSEEDIHEYLLNGAFEISQCRIGSILRLRHDDGKLEIAKCYPSNNDLSPDLSIEKGITGLCLSKLHAINLGSVQSHKHFKAYWPGIVSELAIPLYVPKVVTRIPSETGAGGSALGEGERAFGVLNLESPIPNAFSDIEGFHLGQLAQAASSMLDRIQYQTTLNKLHEAESVLAKELAEVKPWREIVESVADHIGTTLSFSHVNVSLVSPDGRKIKSEHLRWQRSQDEIEDFKRLSDHEIATSKDVQARVVRSREIDVPRPGKPGDNGFHPEIHHRFGLDTLVRVYLPLLMGDIVVGTVEAGYPRKFRKSIFERDVQVLKSLADYATAAIWKKRREQLDDLLRHQVRIHKVGVLENAAFLERNWQRLPHEKITLKLRDIAHDGEILYRLVDRFEYYLNGKHRVNDFTEVDLAKRVIQKTIFQQDSLLRSYGLDLGMIQFVGGQGKTIVVVDEVKISEVFSNVLGNAIKYRKATEGLSIKIWIESKGEFLSVFVQDNGIGVDDGFEERIFEQGERSPLATSNALGSGLGLWISRQYMRGMDGDVFLEKPRNPTVFRIQIKKRPLNDRKNEASTH